MREIVGWLNRMLFEQSDHAGRVSSLGNTETKLLKMNALGSACVCISK